MSGRVVHLWQYRMRRERDLARRMRMQERKATVDLGYTQRRNVSDAVPKAWAGVAAVLLAEFDIDRDPKSAA